MDGWIKLHRKLIEWEWYQDTNVKVVFLHLLLTANHEDKKWQGITIKRGQLVTSYGNLAKSLKLSVKQVRGALDKLKWTSEVATKTTNKFTLVTIVNYDLYQCDERERASKKANDWADKGQTKGKQRATNNNDKNIRNISTTTIEFWQNNLGELTPYGLQMLESYLEDFNEDVLIYAMQKAVENNVRTIRYVKGILDSWKNKDLKNLTEIKNESKKSKVKQIKSNSRNYSNDDYSRLYANG